ncbi:enoyl-CoA hydratase/isomerase family protein [Pseudoroseomonas cervicalis]|uniref:enoyl-CoA hydratase/isomerase family protein n=1 Tax=Teichococcus cervicalis TaxID=204525 RepID=UPI0022F17C0E|nr:enoyl-CoA hydratase-related protein [Pseudoroseomonas cervicalis]WBV42671.1 enoyl-CoA hydratase-related protein [Pseudoroseomonas cervicalis]
MPNPHLRVSRTGPVATVVIDRIEKRNCLDLPMWEAMAEIFTELSADDSLGCVILRGAGEEAFCAGADIGRFGQDHGGRAKDERYAGGLGGAIAAIRDCRHPVVAAIAGWCMGGGAALATACDFRVGGEGARIGIPARKLGIWYPHAALDLLLGIVGYPVACELLIEGRVLEGKEAKALGLLNRCVPDAAVFAEAEALAARICEGAPLSNRFHKQALRALRGPLPIPPETLAEAGRYTETEDFRNAVQAFLEKRRPVFAGR